MKLPELLAGPLLRRVEENRVYIWICMSKYYTLNAQLYTVTSSPSGYDYSKLPNTTFVKTIPFSKNLYIYLLEITPATTSCFPIDQLLAYNIYFTNGNRSHDLNAYHLLTPNQPHSIVYGDLSYPTFFITEKESNILYGSCRKPHGRGYDALANGDTLLEKDYNKLDSRPSALFLLGDQIYADDVADPLSLLIIKIGKKLMSGKGEEIEKIEPKIAEKPFKTCFDQIHGRQFIMEQFASFTSQHAHNHLARFGEFAAMYTMTFSPFLWKMANEQELFLSFETCLENGYFHFAFSSRNEHRRDRKMEVKRAKERYEKQLEAIIQFQETIGKISRLLANIPTYMIFDDHDVTDDWNLSLNWKKGVENSPLGSHIICNALTAYWAFQGWGNDPIQFKSPFIQSLIRYFQTPQYNTSSYTNWKESLLDATCWSFLAPTSPTGLFLDTRTNREYEDKPFPERIGSIIKENSSPPQLMNSKSWHYASKLLSVKKRQRGEKLIIVSPLPIYGLEGIDSLLWGYLYPMRIKGIPIETMLDIEKWRYNSKGFEAFHHFISEMGIYEAIVLSGDSHYSTSIQATVQKEDNTSFHLQEFSSSPLKNESYSPIVRGVLHSFMYFYHLFYASKSADTETASRFISKIESLTKHAEKRIQTKNNLGLLTCSDVESKNFLITNKKESITKKSFPPTQHLMIDFFNKTND